MLNSFIDLLNFLIHIFFWFCTCDTYLYKLFAHLYTNEPLNEILVLIPDARSADTNMICHSHTQNKDVDEGLCQNLDL